MDGIGKSSERKFDWIFLDFDGVLVKFNWQWIYDSYLEVCKSEGIDHKQFFKNIDEFFKWGTPNGRDNFNLLGVQDYQRAYDTYYTFYNRNIRPLPYVEDLLQNLRKAGYKMVIVTNRHAENARKILGYLAGYFEIIVGAEHVEKYKPDSEGINVALKITGAKKERTIMLGDSPFDIIAGAGAQVKLGAVIWEHGSQNLIEFKDIKPDYVINCVGDFYRLFL